MKGMWVMALALWCLVVISEGSPDEMEGTIAGQENLEELFESEPEGLEMKRERRETHKYFGKYTVNCDSLDGKSVFIDWTDGELRGERTDGGSIDCSTFFPKNFYVGPGSPNAQRTKVNMEDGRILVQSQGCITKESPDKCNDKMIWTAGSVKWTATQTNFRCFTPVSTDCKSVKAVVSGTTVQGTQKTSSCTRDCPILVAKVDAGPIVEVSAG